MGALSVGEEAQAAVSLSASTSGTEKRRLNMPGESRDIAEGITGNINPGSISVPYTSVDISVSSSG